MSTNSTDREPDGDVPSPFCEPSDFRVPDGEELRQLRILCDMTLSEVAEEIDRNRKTISRWEQGDRSPTIDDVTALLNCYQQHADGQTQLRV